MGSTRIIDRNPFSRTFLAERSRPVATELVCRDDYARTLTRRIGAGLTILVLVGWLVAPLFTA